MATTGSGPICPRRRRWLAAGACLALGLAGAPAWAGLPAAYQPMVVLPAPQVAGAPPRWEFDLTPALARARSEKKHLYLYIGADDCPYCRRYEAFLQQNATELAPHFAREYLVVDLRSTLRASGARLFIRVGEVVLPYADYQRSIGDERARQLVYPSVWLLNAQGQPLMQMPAGTGTFETVPEQLEILRREQ